MNYGFRTDEAIETLLDTGDIFFATIDCGKMLEPIGMWRWMVEKLFSKNKEWDVVALGIRDANGI